MRPILFSGGMVRAILAGKKTQTRRVINKLLRAKFTSCSYARISEFQPSSTPGYKWTFRDKGLRWHDFDTTEKVLDLCPYGKPGERLYVREAWRIGAWRDGGIAVDYKADGFARREWIPISEEMYKRYEKQCLADCEQLYGKREHYEWEPGKGPFRWRPSIHMPRQASRILLEIKEVRLQCLQGLSEEDARAEGVEPNWCGPLDSGPNGFGGVGWVEECGWENYLEDEDGDECETAVESYSTLWDSINAKRGYPWEANPWVWVIEFKVVTQ